jgi:hypothetical protein
MHWLPKVARFGIAILAGIGAVALVGWLAMPPDASRAGEMAYVSPLDRPATNASYPACGTDAVVFAEYQAWHGLPSHQQPPPYTSTDPAVIRRHIRMAQEQCIDGFVVDWYGPPAGMPNDQDRAFIDLAFDELLAQAETYNFKAALMYDEGTLRGTAPLTATRAISDLRYAAGYFARSSYLSINNRPALFIFPYPDVDPDIDWHTVRQQLGISLTLIDEDPNPDQPAHDAHFDGFYAWVQATNGQWQADGSEWGEAYLRWFYPTMAGSPYGDKVTVGGVWPGFDDSLARWGSNRYMSRRCGQTWADTWRLVEEYDPPYVMIATWNDFEEGTDIENGIGCRLYLPAVSKPGAGR